MKLANADGTITADGLACGCVDTTLGAGAGTRTMTRDEEPTTASRCCDCGEPIDPANYMRTRRGFACEPCMDEWEISQIAYPSAGYLY